MKKLAIITSHPIQYNAPLFRLLTARGNIRLKVFYTWGQTKTGLVYDPDFQKEFQWDIPLQEGYEKEFIENISPNPSAGNFKGIDNKDLIERIDAYNPDALLVYGWSFRSHLKAIRFFKGKRKIIFRGDSTLLDEPTGFSIKKTARRIFLKWVYRYIDIALYTGEANRQYFLKHGLSETQLIYAPHAIENERFFDIDAEYVTRAKAWRKQLNISDYELVFLFAGKLESKKDPLLLFDAFKEINAQHMHLIFAGNGVLELELKQRAKDDERVHFLDFQNQQSMPVVYRLADVFVLPSKGPGETWGLSINEAMACGKPVIVSDKCGGASDLVQGNGIIFSSGKKEELKKAMLYFADNPAEREKMSSMSLKQIAGFSISEIANSIENIV